MILNVNELFIVVIVLFASYSIGAFFKLLQFKMSYFITFTIAFLLPFLVLKMTATATYRSVLNEGIKEGFKTFGYCILSLPLHVRVIGEVSAEVYAKQVARKRIYKKYNIEQRPQDIILIRSNFPAIKDIISDVSKSMMEDKHNGYKMY
ncbi:hypothetical protein [Bacillus cereus]|uniref:hypothetical protein n=1 Tax=Bacillus cereus TaxID=1396 RepID=UPI000BF705AD|nr:hypothetical protein [Bacillus cereus]MDF3555410.1 hypothetical protein [Bacillus cereus]PEY32658.1 hypothetical protein CN347_21575 [Bacillus cereus]PGM02916.1 hypothetical protein CN935_27340 [Bacillus cereus]PGZ85407.1 hypothetical protein COE64_15780 [Bacillus cereus]